MTALVDDVGLQRCPYTAGRVDVVGLRVQLDQIPRGAEIYPLGIEMRRAAALRICPSDSNSPFASLYPGQTGRRRCLGVALFLASERDAAIERRFFDRADVAVQVHLHIALPDCVPSDARFFHSLRVGAL